MTPPIKKLLILSGLGLAGWFIWRRYADNAQLNAAAYLGGYMNLPQTSGINDAMAIIDSMLANNPLQRSTTSTTTSGVAVYGINPDAPAIYL